MTPDQIREARSTLGLSQHDLALMLGYEGHDRRVQVSHLERGMRVLRPAQRRLLEAYLAGYRPPDWPR